MRKIWTIGDIRVATDPPQEFVSLDDYIKLQDKWQLSIEKRGEALDTIEKMLGMGDKCEACGKAPKAVTTNDGIFFCISCLLQNHEDICENSDKLRKDLDEMQTCHALEANKVNELEKELSDVKKVTGYFAPPKDSQG